MSKISIFIYVTYDFFVLRMIESLDLDEHSGILELPLLQNLFFDNMIFQFYVRTDIGRDFSAYWPNLLFWENSLWLFQFHIKP